MHSLTCSILILMISMVIATSTVYPEDRLLTDNLSTQTTVSWITQPEDIIPTLPAPTQASEQAPIPIEQLPVIPIQPITVLPPTTC